MKIIDRTGNFKKSRLWEISNWKLTNDLALLKKKLNFLSGYPYTYQKEISK